MTSDDKHHEREAIDREKLEQRKILKEAIEKGRERTWGFWQAFVICNSNRLTLAGINAVYWATKTLEQTLGEDFLQKAATEAPSPHPTFFPNFWPCYDLALSYANLFQLAAQIELLKSTVGWPKVRKPLRNDVRLDRWVSTLLQIEVAALGLKEGWHIKLEQTLPNKKKNDVTLAKESTKLLVEIKALLLSGEEQEESEYFLHMSGALLELALNYGVRITRSPGSHLPPDIQTQWLQEIKEEVIKTANDGIKRVVGTPSHEGG